MAKLMFFCAVAGAYPSIRVRTDLMNSSTYSGKTNVFAAVNPTTLSGKQPSNPRKAVSAIFAAIVIHSVPAGQSLLC